MQTPSKQKKWNVLKIHNADRVKELSQKTRLHPILVNILIQRGIDTEEKINNLLNPDLGNLHSPFLMRDIDKAVSRIIQALENKEKILVYGDYDVDGTTSVAFFSFFLEYLDHPYRFYVPDRNEEGYGLSVRGVDFAKENNCSLIVTFDCGTKEIQAVEYAKEQGIDVIIADHHEITGEAIAEPLALINPKHPECPYPFKELSACGLAYKLVEAVEEKLQSGFVVEDYLDLVAMSTICDMVPLLDENYIIAKLGIRKMKKNPVVGIRRLLESSGIINWEALSEAELGFQLGPRINAAGRMAHAKEAVKLLLGKTKDANLLNEQNRKRKFVQDETLQQALEQLERENKENSIIILANENWYKGVVGIIASKLLEKFYKPVVILAGNEDGTLAGSCRSIAGFNITKALDKFKHLLEKYGGHEAAAGFTIKKENFEEFKQKLTEFANRTLRPEDLIPVITVDSPLPFYRINFQFAEQINLLAPFGMANPLPVFRSTNVEIIRQNPMRKNPNNVFLTLKQENSIKEAVFWNGYALFPELKNAKRISIVYSLEIWEGNAQYPMRSLKLNIKDLKILS